jgi:superoxide dismutase, Cu-Zn family
MKVVERPNEKGGLNVTLRVWRLAPSRRYDLDVYTRPCGATPAAAGRRTQDGPSTEHYPQNEVWLDFKTDRRGNATASAAQYWIFEPGEANSVVIRSHATGARVACVTVPFT